MPTLTTNKAPLERVFLNLISNCIKHHDKSEGRIEIECRENDAGLEFAVRDDGPGIPRKYHNQVFEMFRTLKPRDEVEGSGMGLPLVKKIIEHEGGSIAIESEGRGTCFHFVWPVNKPAK